MVVRQTVPVSVVVSSFQEGHRLSETIASVERADVLPREVVVVDDGSADGSCDRRWSRLVRVLRTEHTGVAAARNHGARAADQPVLVFLDAHCTVGPGWLTPLVEALDQVPEALVGPAMADASDARFVGCGAEIVDPLMTYRWRATTVDRLCEVGLVPGGCLAVRRDRFLAAGGFAAFTGFGLEDVELALRWWRSGRPALGARESVVSHRFRSVPPYRPEGQAWLQNILRTALLHLSDRYLRDSVLACSRFSAFPLAVATVLAEPWTAVHRRLLATEARAVTAYLERWAPEAFRA